MKYNQVRIGDGVIANEKNVVIHSLGTLDWNIYDCISNNHIADEVIKNSVITSWKITEKRLNNYLRNKDVIYKKA